jgi:hypothetical protein
MPEFLFRLTDETQGAAILSHPWSVHSIAEDRIKQDTNWNMASTSYDPLDLY